MLTPKNARGRPVTKLCLALETFRRTDEGRVRDARAFLGHFFPIDKTIGVDRLFVHIPKEVRADLLSNWGIRGKKSALRDDDEKVRGIVADALAAGDIDAPVIEDGVTPEILIDWIPLEDWWSFWRGSVLPIGSVRKALALARDLSLFDERWFLENLQLTAQRLDGTDVICAALSKEQVVAWLTAVHQSGDASPSGLVSALGWETVLQKTAHEALLHALDALARQIGLAEGGSAVNINASTSSPPVRPSSLPKPSVPPPPAPPPAATIASPAASSGASTAVASGPAPSPSRDAQQPAVTQPQKPPPPPPAASPPKPTTSSTTSASTSAPSASPVEVRVSASTASPGAPSKQQVTQPMPTAPQRPPPPPAAKPQTQELPSVIVEPDPFASAPPQPPVSRPDPRHLFGAAPQQIPSGAAAAAAAAGPMRAPAETLSGVGAPPPPPATPQLFEATSKPEVAIPSFHVPPVDPAWAPPRAEPGDMGWDIVYGVKRPMGTNVQPKYNFDDDDEPTSEIALPGDPRRSSSSS